MGEAETLALLPWPRCHILVHNDKGPWSEAQLLWQQVDRMQDGLFRNPGSWSEHNLVGGTHWMKTQMILKRARGHKALWCVFYWYPTSARSWEAIPWDILYPTRQNGSSVASQHCNIEEDRSITLQQRDEGKWISVSGNITNDCSSSGKFGHLSLPKKSFPSTDEMTGYEPVQSLSGDWARCHS